MKHIDVVDAEGEPLLLADAMSVQSDWRGTEGNGSDYERACSLLIDSLPGHSITIGTTEGIIWDMEGAGTADVFVDNAGCIVIVRAWIDDPTDVKTVLELAEVPITTEAVDVGTVRITSGVLVILSSVENGTCIQSLSVSSETRPTGNMTTVSSGLLLSVPIGDYTGIHDEVSLVDGQSARRCHLIRNDLLKLRNLS